MSDTRNRAVDTPEISRITEHLFRQEAGKLVSVLTGIFGIERLQLAEDVVQEALVRAFQTWPYYGVPNNPAAWLTQTAKNLALDLLRREKVFQQKQPQIIAHIEQWPSDSGADDLPLFDHEIKDGGLRLMFACCHPLIPRESQTALALKTLCGFGPDEIAKAFLTTEAAIAKRLTRARQKIRELRIPFEIPLGNELEARLDSVLQTLYLLFNEGYKASSGENLIREELCSEAIRLVQLLVEHPAGSHPRTHALLALMLLSAARLPGRVDAHGHILLLKDQDRSSWDRKMIARGFFHLANSASGDQISDYHLESAIAACHCAAPDYESTDWTRILSLYNQLAELNNSPVVALNRAVATGKVHGPKEGVAALEAIHNREALASYYLYYAVLAEFKAELKQFAAAASDLRKALQYAHHKSEKALLEQRLADWEASIPKHPSLQVGISA